MFFHLSWSFFSLSCWFFYFFFQMVSSLPPPNLLLAVFVFENVLLNFYYYYYSTTTTTIAIITACGVIFESEDSPFLSAFIPTLPGSDTSPLAAVRCRWHPLIGTSIVSLQVRLQVCLTPSREALYVLSQVCCAYC